VRCGCWADALRARRNQLRTRWRRLDAGRQAMPVAGYLGKGATYADLGCGFAVGASTVYRYVKEGIGLLAAMASILDQAIEVARGKAYVIPDGSVLRIDRVAMPWGSSVRSPGLTSVDKGLTRPTVHPGRAPLR
jgi:hypothetical protein